MEKIEIWEVASGREAATSPLSTIDSTKTEEELEEILVTSPDMLERGLQLVGRQTLMTGGGKPRSLGGGWRWQTRRV